MLELNRNLTLLYGIRYYDDVGENNMAKEKVLFIEDDEDIQELVRYNLEREGYDLKLAGSAEDGLKAASSWSP